MDVSEKVKALVENKHYLYLNSLAESMVPDNTEEQALLDSIRWSLETIRRHVAFAIVAKEKNSELADTSLLIPKNPPPPEDDNCDYRPQLRLVK